MSLFDLLRYALFLIVVAVFVKPLGGWRFELFSGSLARRDCRTFVDDAMNIWSFE